MQNDNSKVKIEENHTGWRLDKFIKEHYPEYSRSYIQKTIEAGQVLVNQKIVRPHHFLKMGDEVEIKIEAPKELRIEPNPNIVLDVIHEEPDFLVINKPAGLVVHQGEGHKESDTLVNGLLAHYPEIAKVCDPLFDGLRPGIVHRLDKEASGVMIIARNQNAFDHLKKQFKLRKVKKEYIALVHGKVSPPEGIIEFAIGRKGSKMAARPKGEAGKMAMTEYEIIIENSKIQKSKKFTLLRIRTYTGRTHQIRVHLFALGYPIAGDPLYQSKISKISKISRLMLHAQKLGFYNLDGGWSEYETILPDEFKNFEF